MLHCSAYLLCFFNIKCSIKQPLPRVLSLIAPILKIPHHHTFTHKAAIRFLSSLHQLLYFLPLSIFEGSATFYCSPIFLSVEQGCVILNPDCRILFLPFSPFSLLGNDLQISSSIFCSLPFHGNFLQLQFISLLHSNCLLIFSQLEFLQTQSFTLNLYINLQLDYFG